MSNTAKKIGPGVSVVKAKGAQVEAFAGKGEETQPAQNVNDLLAQIARLQAQNEQLQKQKASGGKLTCKVAFKGGVSVYGLGRFPVTLYPEQWTKLKNFLGEVEAFIEANDGKTVKVKGTVEGVEVEKEIVFSKTRTE